MFQQRYFGFFNKLKNKINSKYNNDSKFDKQAIKFHFYMYNQPNLLSNKY